MPSEMQLGTVILDFAGNVQNKVHNAIGERRSMNLSQLFTIEKIARPLVYVPYFRFMNKIWFLFTM